MFNFRVNNWFCVLARFCDYSIFFLFLGAISLFLPLFYEPFFYYFLALAIPVLWVPVEALLVSKWATTPGKFLFGLSMRQVVGYKLSYREALQWALFLPNRPGVMRQKNVSWIRKLFGFLTSTAFGVAAICGNLLATWSTGLNQEMPQKGWVQYMPDDAKFKISFPKDPEESSKELVIPHSNKVLSYEEASHQTRKVHYSVAHLQIPGKWRLAASATVLKEVLNQLVARSENTKIVQRDFNKFGRYRVLDYRLKEGENLVKGRLIIVSGTLYKLTMTYPSSCAQEIEENPFLDSFEVT